MPFRRKIRKARKTVNLDHYHMSLEEELIKYNLNCRCDNFAGGSDDGGAMRMAHVALTKDLMDPLKRWIMADEMDRKLAEAYQIQVDLRGWASVDSAQWEKVKKDKARYDSQVREAWEGLLAFENLNKGLFCDMKIGQTLWRLGWA